MEGGNRNARTSATQGDQKKKKKKRSRLPTAKRPEIVCAVAQKEGIEQKELQRHDPTEKTSRRRSKRDGK